MKVGKPIHFSHDPEAIKEGALWDEYVHVIEKKSYVYDENSKTAWPL